MPDPSDEVVLFIHSTGTSPLLWRGVTDDVVGGRRGLHPANLGYPPNPAVARGATLTLDEEAAHLARAIPGEARRVHLVGHSYGATVALVLAEHASVRERLASMFLAEPVLFGALAKDAGGEVATHDPEAVTTTRELLATSPLLDDARGGRADWLEAFIDYWNRPGSWSKMPEPMKEQALAVGWKMYQEVRACFAADRPFAAWTIAVPTTLAVGERTTIHSRAMSRALARRHPREDLALVEMKGTGHMAPLTHPAVVLPEVAKHFARV